MWEKEVIYYNGEVVKADSKKEAINKWMDSQDRENKITGVTIKDSHTFDEGSIFEQTYYLVSGVSIGE